MMKFAIVRALIVPLLALLVSAPAVAFAAAPMVQFQSLDQSYILPRLSARCGFPVLKQVTGTMRITLTNLNTGTSYTSTSAGSEHIIYDNGQLVSDTTTGLYESINVPGAGQVFVEVGRLTVDAQGNIVFETGEHDITDFNVTGTFDPAALCAAL